MLSGINCRPDKKLPPPVPELFDSFPVVHNVSPVIKEASGIAASRTSPGDLWVVEDSDNPNEIILIGNDGKVKNRCVLLGAVNRDWEEICFSDDSLYVGDIGDNAMLFGSYTFYVFSEPSANTDTVKNIRTVSFKYPDGSHNAEAFFVDPGTGDIYIITKNDQPSYIYKLSFPYSSAINTCTKIGEMKYSQVVSSAISTSGAEMIVKTYDKLNYYTGNNSQTIVESLLQTPVRLPYGREPHDKPSVFRHHGMAILL
ncbi:hypothetical protein BH20BAC1_BH20BAC1_28310 [soil metagenome]